MGDDYVDLNPDESVEQQVETGASENGAVVAGDADVPGLPIIVPGLFAIQTDGAALASAPIVRNPELINLMPIRRYRSDALWASRKHWYMIWRALNFESAEH